MADSGLCAYVGHQSMVSKTPERWWDSTDEALQLLKDKGISCLLYVGHIGDVVSHFNGEIWQP
jgi:hypothetical protein